MNNNQKFKISHTRQYKIVQKKVSSHATKRPMQNKFHKKLKIYYLHRKSFTKLPKGSKNSQACVNQHM